MKRMLKAFLLFAMIYPVFYQMGYADGPFVKLGRGLTNIITSPAEIIFQPTVLSQEHNMWIAWFGGFPKGLVFFPVRALAGVYEVATFPIPFPGDYGPVMNPETLVEGFDRLNY